MKQIQIHTSNIYGILEDFKKEKISFEYNAEFDENSLTTTIYVPEDRMFDVERIIKKYRRVRF